jgi:hypothetical protein
MRYRAGGVTRRAGRQYAHSTLADRLAIFAGLAAFIGFTFRQGMRVKPDRDKNHDEWTGSAGGGPPSDDSGHSG